MEDCDIMNCMEMQAWFYEWARRNGRFTFHDKIRDKL